MLNTILALGDEDAEGKLGEKPRYTGRVLAVEIAYDKKTKKHSCKIEVLRKRI